MKKQPKTKNIIFFLIFCGFSLFWPPHFYLSFCLCRCLGTVCSSMHTSCLHSLCRCLSVCLPAVSASRTFFTLQASKNLQKSYGNFPDLFRKFSRNFPDLFRKCSEHFPEKFWKCSANCPEMSWICFRKSKMLIIKMFGQRLSIVFVISRPDLGTPDIPRWLYIQFVTRNPNLKSRIFEF